MRSQALQSLTLAPSGGSAGARILKLVAALRVPADVILPFRFFS